MDNLYEGVYDLISRNSNHDPIMILMPGTNVNVVKVLLNLKPIINDVKNIYDSVVWLAKLMINGQGKVVLESLVDGIGDKLLTSYYIKNKATTRLDDIRMIITRMRKYLIRAIWNMFCTEIRVKK